MDENKIKSCADRAEELFRNGANCSQAVVGAFSDILGIEDEKLMKLSSSFGGGIARMRLVCGAVTGGVIVLGTVLGFDVNPTHEDKKEHYIRITDFVDAFARANGSYNCSQLLGVERSSPEPTVRDENFYRTRPCIRCIRYAAESVEKILSNNK